MAEENMADPQFSNGWMHSVSHSNDSVHKLRKNSQSGSGPDNHQSFVPFDNTGYRMVQQQSNKTLPNDMMNLNKPVADHNNKSSRNGGEFIFDIKTKTISIKSDQQPFVTPATLKSLSINNVLTSDAFSQEQFLKFKNIVIKGCESAEHLAYFHRNRPCFKKINCLCACLKQDVDRADSVLANINSQGVPWAVKDFIFVYTRIVSAWNIIKDYVYNNSDGMRTIKSAISDRLVVSFLKWQEVTSDFVEDLTKSFDGLQELTLSQTRNGDSQKSAESNQCSAEQKANNNSDTESFDSFKITANDRPGSDRSSTGTDGSTGHTHSNVKQLSIGSDRKFEYIKTGVYKCTVAAPNGNHSNHLNSNTSVVQPHRVATMETEQMKCVNARTYDVRKAFFTNILSGIPNNCARNASTQEQVGHRHASPEVVAKNSTDTSHDAATSTSYRKSLKSELLQKVSFIEESKFFFSSHSTKKYFPDFLKIVPDFVDLRSIIVNSEMEVLYNIYDFIYQIRKIFCSAKRYLQERPHELLAACAAIFERDFESLLIREFPDHDKRMTGYDF